MSEQSARVSAEPNTSQWAIIRAREELAQKAELVEKCARAIAHSHGLDFDEVCGVDADPDHGYCDSGTCIASGYEEHDAAYARACYLSDARAALAIAMPAAFEMVEALGCVVCGGDCSSANPPVMNCPVQSIRELGEKWK